MNYKSKIDVGGKEKVVVAINYKEELIQSIQTERVENIHFLFMIDRSGSMYSDINKLIDSVSECFEVISDDDYISIIWFASAGQYRTVIKAAKKSDKLQPILDTLRSTLGCTCFSESFAEINTIISEIGSIAPISITLFTDGNANAFFDEKQRTMKEIIKMKNEVLAINCIGFSNYYDQEFLKQISNESQFGSFEHISKIKEFTTIFTHNFEKIADVVSDSLNVKANGDLIYLNRKFSKMIGNEFNLTKIDKRKNQVFVVLNEESEIIVNGETINTKSIKTNLNGKMIDNFYQSYAYNLYYNNRRLESLDILLYNLGDKFLIDSHMKSFTFDECSTHIKKLEQAIFDNNKRLLDGVVSTTYIPNEKTPCIMDVLNFLQESGKSFYIPFSDNVAKYTRIGKETSESVNYFTWTKDEIKVPFYDFVYNKKQANLSIRMSIPGVVRFNPKQAKALNMPLTMDSIIYRNHSIIKDGCLNIKQIEVLIADEDYSYIDSFDIFSKEFGFEEINGKMFYRRILDLSLIPIINRSYINKATSTEDIFDKTLKITELETRQKIVNYYLDKVEEKSVLKKVDKLAGYTTEQITFLEEHGLSKELVYQGMGKTQKAAEDCDSYEAKSVEFTLAGFSSYPKVEDLIEKRAANKKLTPSLIMMAEQYDNLKDNLTNKKVLLEKVNAAMRDALIDELKSIKKELNSIRNELSVLKLAKLLSGDSYNDLTLNDKNDYVYIKNGYTMVAKFKYVTEYL